MGRRERETETERQRETTANHRACHELGLDFYIKMLTLLPHEETGHIELFSQKKNNFFSENPLVRIKI